MGAKIRSIVLSAATGSLSGALMKAAASKCYGGAHIVAAFSLFRGRRRRSSSLPALRPSLRHPLLPLLTDERSAKTESCAPECIQSVFLRAGIARVAFIRHGNTAPAPVDFDRTLTDLGRHQSRAAGSSYGARELRPYYEGGALCSSAPRCVETAELFLDSSRERPADVDEEDGNGADVMPSLKLRSELYDGTMQPEGSRLFRSIGYAPLRRYLENPDEDDREAAGRVLGEYAQVSLDVLWNVVLDHLQSDETLDDCAGKTLLFFAHAIYLPSAALGFATAIGCGSQGAAGKNGGGLGLILDTNTKEAEGYCVHVDAPSISLLKRPKL